MQVVFWLCSDRPAEADCSALRAEGLSLIHGANRDLLLEELFQRRPDALIYTLRRDQAADVAVLQLVRRLHPDLPVILVAEECSLQTEKLVRELRPVYYAVSPVEPDELREAVRAALARRTRGAAADRTGDA
jgi:DNA-binding NtrC family response regulator